jgi:hypothetical protein
MFIKPLLFNALLLLLTVPTFAQTVPASAPEGVKPSPAAAVNDAGAFDSEDEPTLPDDSSIGLDIPHAKYTKMSAEHADDEGGEVATAHDLPANDPSPAERLTLPKVMPQKHVILHGVNKHINRTVRQALSTKSMKALREYFPTQSGEEADQPKKFTYLDAVEDKTLFSFLRINEHRYVPKLEFGPSLVNSDAEFKGISDRAFGFCWGFSTLVRDFTTLAFFDPSLPRETSMDFYKDKIDAIVRGEATIIPGFANLREFSLVPEYEFYMKMYTMELWRDRAFSFPSVKVILHASKAATADETEATVSDLEARIARGEMPKIIFSALVASEKTLGMNTDIHVVLPYKVERRADKHILIHLWDIDFYTETLVREPKVLEITPDYAIHYAPWYEPNKAYAQKSDLISSIQITPDNDRETLMMMLNLKKFCSDSANAKYCALNGTH